MDHLLILITHHGYLVIFLIVLAEALDIPLPASLALVGGGRAQLKTDVTLADGEKVVVGTSTVQDKALVVLLSARVIR